jgi:hypothetical protein
VAEGKYEELTKAPAYDAARKRAYALCENRPGWWFPAGAKTKASPERVPVIFRIEIEALSGREASRSKRTAGEQSLAAATKAPQWWSHVLRPAHGVSARSSKE